CFGQVPHNLRLQILDLVENGERPVLEDRVSVYGQDSSFHNSQIGVKAYSRNLAGGIYPARLLASPLFPGRWLGKMLRGNRVRRPKMNLRHLPKDTCALTFNQLSAGRLDGWRHSPPQSHSVLLSLRSQPG